MSRRRKNAKRKTHMTTHAATAGELKSRGVHMPSQPASAATSSVYSQFRTARAATRSLAANLSAEDQMIQSCADASPIKWHQAHTTWFFETFVLRPFLKDYQPFREEFRWLFNSYYNSLGEQSADKTLAAY